MKVHIKFPYGLDDLYKNILSTAFEKIPKLYKHFTYKIEQTQEDRENNELDIYIHMKNKAYKNRAIISTFDQLYVNINLYIETKYGVDYYFINMRCYRDGEYHNMNNNEKLINQFGDDDTNLWYKNFHLFFNDKLGTFINKLINGEKNGGIIVKKELPNDKHMCKFPKYLVQFISRFADYLM